MFIKRHVISAVKNAAQWFPVVLLTGSRQVGKSTLLQKEFADLHYLTLDAPSTMIALQEDALGFLSAQGTPLILDEVQYAPEAFRLLKYLVDQNRRAGMFYLTGSQKYSLMQGITESLAGRIAIIDMQGLSNRELAGDDFNQPFLPTKEYFLRRKSKINYSPMSLWQRIHRGSYPELWDKEDLPWGLFYENYLQSYLQRDIRNMGNVANILSFSSFIVALAARIGSTLNIAELSRDIGVDVKTIKHWLAILEAGNVIFLLQPFRSNASKRVSKAPKVYFTDTGLVSFLGKWHSSEVLQNGALAGSILENFVIMEIIKSYQNAGTKPELFYYRDNHGNEIDLLLYHENVLHPLEIKKTLSPDIRILRKFKILSEVYPEITIGEGGIICPTNERLALNENNWLIPINEI